MAVHLLPVWRRWENLGDTEISEIPVSPKNPKGEKGGEKEKKEEKKRKKALVREKRLKKIRAPRHPSGGPPGAPPAGPSGGRPGRGLGWGLVCFAEVLLVFEDSLGPAPPLWTVTLPSKYRALTGSEMLSAFFRLRSTM